MGKNQNSVVVLQIWVKSWCMISMGVKHNHTKFERETQRWRPGEGFASGGPQLQKLQFRAKNSHFWAKNSHFWAKKKPWNTFKAAKRRETVGTRHVPLDFPVSTSSLRPSNSMTSPGNGPKRPREVPNADSHKPRIGHIFGYMAQNAIPRAPTPPATSHFLGFPQATPTTLARDSCKLPSLLTRHQAEWKRPGTAMAATLRITSFTTCKVPSVQLSAKYNLTRV